jgi:hypothetical protein
MAYLRIHSATAFLLGPSSVFFSMSSTFLGRFDITDDSNKHREKLLVNMLSLTIIPIPSHEVIITRKHREIHAITMLGQAASIMAPSATRIEM